MESRIDHLFKFQGVRRIQIYVTGWISFPLSSWHRSKHCYQMWRNPSKRKAFSPIPHIPNAWSLLIFSFFRSHVSHTYSRVDPTYQKGDEEVWKNAALQFWFKHICKKTFAKFSLCHLCLIKVLLKTGVSPTPGTSWKYVFTLIYVFQLRM